MTPHHRLLAAALCAASLVACGEEPQLLILDEATLAAERLERAGELRERTTSQGESARMAY